LTDARRAVHAASSGFEYDRVMTNAQRDAGDAVKGLEAQRTSAAAGSGRNEAAEAIHIEDLHKKFGQLHVLKGVSLSARDGDVVAIIGGSGSGKSTLLRCINCLENPTSGIIRVNGEEILLKADSHGDTHPADRRQIERIRSRLGMVFQNFNLWSHMTLIENVIEVPIHVLGMRRDEAIASAEKLLDRVGLADKRDVYPAFMSGGQQQRGAIARALAIQPRVMLFDEPTSALDPELVGEVLKVIADLAREGRTMILVTHEMKFARGVASHVVYLYNGLVEEEGPPEQIFGAPKSERLKQFLRNVG
jgi:octopine/nopaline transport system ATP-binding protein